jgi:transglutaminase-like putative cysteine protease
MYVCTDAPPPIPEDFFPEEYVLTGPKYYWKGTTYDTYLGRQWTNGLHRAVVVPAYDPVIKSVVTPTLTLKQRYLIEVTHKDTLYAAGEAHVVDQQVESRQRMADDLVGLQGSTNDYVVDSLIPQATVGQMMAVSETYPSHIESRYLQLPNDLPERVRTLALEITQDVDSNYEKALAIERYLRQFPYDLKVPTPPQGRDVADYFLFDAQRGYCDYYATSFVVLARAAGIPARLAVGYAMGGFSPRNGCYVVVEMDAHSWPELYFGEHGWIPFEPTAAFRVFERPDDPMQAANLAPLPQSAPPRPWYIAVREWWRRVRQDWTTYVAIGGGVVLLILLIVWARRARRRQKLSPVEGIAFCYEEMLRMGEQLGTTRRPHDTPAEYATILAAALYARQARWPWSARKVVPVLEEAERGVRTLSRAYERASYSTLLNPPAQRSQVDRLWSGLQKQLRWLRYSSQHPTTAGD